MRRPEQHKTVVEYRGLVVANALISEVATMQEHQRKDEALVRACLTRHACVPTPRPPPPPPACLSSTPAPRLPR